MSGWEKMFESWHRRYYDEPFMFICELTAIIIGLIYQTKKQGGAVFYLLCHNGYFQYLF